MKYFALVLFMLALGCVQSQRYTEGTMTQIGLYIPYNGSLVGFQVLNYLNGCSVNCDTNMQMIVERKHTATNEYFGVVKTIESTETKVEVK